MQSQFHNMIAKIHLAYKQTLIIEGAPRYHGVGPCHKRIPNISLWVDETPARCPTTRKAPRRAVWRPQRERMQVLVQDRVQRKPWPVDGQQEMCRRSKNLKYKHVEARDRKPHVPKKFICFALYSKSKDAIEYPSSCLSLTRFYWLDGPLLYQTKVKITRIGMQLAVLSYILFDTSPLPEKTSTKL